jgi:hypothetical protein
LESYCTSRLHCFSPCAHFRFFVRCASFHEEKPYPWLGFASTRANAQPPACSHQRRTRRCSARLQRTTLKAAEGRRFEPWLTRGHVMLAVLVPAREVMASNDGLEGSSCWP